MLALIKYGDGYYYLETGSGLGIRLSADASMFRLTASHNHQFAKNDWADAEPTALNMEGASLDWRDVILVVARQLDQRLSVRVPVPGISNPLTKRTLTIHVPGVECWYATPYTAIGVNVPQEDTDPVTGLPPIGLARTPTVDQHTIVSGLDKADYARGVLRNDAWILRAIAAIAVEWWGKPRVSVQINTQGLAIRGFSQAAGLQPGAFLRSIDRGSVKSPLETNTVISRIINDNSGTVPRLTIQTGQANLNPVNVVKSAIRAVNPARGS
jgi:hypothetical protein